MTLTQMLRDTGLAERATVHGFHSDLFDRRRRLMDAWAAYLNGTDAKAVALRR